MAAEDHQARSLWRTTLAMMAAATAAIELAIAEPDRGEATSLGRAAAMLVPVLAIAWYLGRSAANRPDPAGSPGEPSRPGRRRGEISPVAVAALLVAFALPFVIEAGRAAWLGRGGMLEILLLAALRNLGLGLATVAYRMTFARLAALVSLFMVAVASAMAEGPWMIAIVGSYAASGCLWLMLAYWHDVRLQAASGDSGRVPIASVALILAILGALFAAAAVGPTRAATALAGLMPTSGGVDWNDPESRGGVDDGDNEVRGSEDPRSIGFTDSEVYLDTDRPSLYDTFNEMYGEPYKPKLTQRMIALGPQEIKEQEERPAENLQAGRQFPMVRRKPVRPPARPGERRAKALVYVNGPTPLHLALAAYDRFDGLAWHEAPHTALKLQPELERGTSWLRSALPSWPAIFAGTVAHQVKIGLLDSSPMPVPSHLVRFRVGSVDRPDFFGWAQDGIVKMEGRTVPAGTVIDAEARTVDPGRLLGIDLPSPAGSGPGDGYRLAPGISGLARAWTSGVPRGWAQVEAIVGGLRRGYVHDRSSTTLHGCSDSARHFLLESRRGPDYQFASAAALLLRSLGYRTRVVSGLYAAPGRYDARTRHTPLTGDDVHFWAEVAVADRTWVAIEPTPGYRLAGPSFSPVERLARAIAGALHWARAHEVAVAACAAALVLAFALRRELLDRLATLAWRVNPGRASRRSILRALRLIERRSRWAGLPRPPGRTPMRWYGSFASASAATCGIQADLERLILLADWACHAPERPGAPPPWTEHDIRTTCRRAVGAWTLGRFRALASTPSRPREVTSP